MDGIRITLAALPEPALLVDARGTVVEANVVANGLFGPSAVGRGLGELLRPAELPDAGGRWRVGGSDAAGIPFVADASCAPPAQDGPRLVLVRRLERTRLVAETQRYLDVAFAEAPIGMALFNPEGEFVRVNAALCRMLAHSPEDLLGRRDQELTHPEDRQADVDAAWRILRGETDTHQTEKRFLRPDGTVVHAIANMVFLRDDEDRPLAWLGQFQDISAHKELEGRWRRLAEEDPLTGLPNRRHLEGEIERVLQLSRRHGTRGALLLIDLDGFKQINDTHGHATGDAALAAVGAALRRRLRASDSLARVGGDEFAVLLPLTGPDRAAQVAAALESEIRAVPAVPGDPELMLRASIGVAALGGPDGPQTPAALLDAADAAMYRIKRRDP